MSDNHVFIYGSLKKNYHNHHWLTDATYIKDAITSDPAYRMHPVAGFFPLVVPGEYYIYGEYYVMDDKTLAGLDFLEGNGTTYTRRKIKLSGVDVLVWMYMYNYPDQLPFDGGDLDILVETVDNTQTWLDPNDYFVFEDE